MPLSLMIIFLFFSLSPSCLLLLLLFSTPPWIILFFFFCIDRQNVVECARLGSLEERMENISCHLMELRLRRGRVNYIADDETCFFLSGEYQTLAILNSE